MESELAVLMNLNTSELHHYRHLRRLEDYLVRSRLPATRRQIRADAES